MVVDGVSVIYMGTYIGPLFVGTAMVVDGVSVTSMGTYIGPLFVGTATVVECVSVQVTFQMQELHM